MAEQMRPESKENAPDPSHAYERSHPGREAGMGRTSQPVATPTDAPDGGKDAVGNAQNPARQLNAQDDAARRHARMPSEQPDHSMKEEEPLGWDQAPTNAQKPEMKRHPRTEGQGGVE
jgi:hypothetical protein